MDIKVVSFAADTEEVARTSCDASINLGSRIKIAEWVVSSNGQIAVIFASVDREELRELGTRWCYLTMDELTENPTNTVSTNSHGAIRLGN